MNIWLFGKSSDFSQHMVDQWHEDGHKVTQLGRENVNYTNPAEFIEEAKDKLPFPDYVVFNINVGVPFELNHPIHNQNVDTQKIIFNEWYQNNLDTNFFKVFVFDWLIENNFKGEIAHITSQIAKDTNPEFKNLLTYKMQRALDYQIIQNQRANGINSYGICPAHIKDVVGWPRYIATLITDVTKDQSWLYGIIKEERQIYYISYPPEGLYDTSNDLP